MKTASLRSVLLALLVLAAVAGPAQCQRFGRQKIVTRSYKPKQGRRFEAEPDGNGGFIVRQYPHPTTADNGNDALLVVCFGGFVLLCLFLSALGYFFVFVAVYERLPEFGGKMAAAFSALFGRGKEK